MRAGLIVVAVALSPQLVAAADFDRPYARHRHVRVSAGAHAYGAIPVAAPFRPIVVAPRATLLVVPPGERPPGHLYAPPPVPISPPPLIAAVPIVGPYLVPRPLGPPPATVLDAYDHRDDYNE
jgi:hypothetical protein